MPRMPGTIAPRSASKPPFLLPLLRARNTTAPAYPHGIADWAHALHPSPDDARFRFVPGARLEAVKAVEAAVEEKKSYDPRSLFFIFLFYFFPFLTVLISGQTRFVVVVRAQAAAKDVIFAPASQ